jgi:hypothetical protein
MNDSNVTDAEIEAAFSGTNFGHTKYRKLLEASVLKKAVGYHCGHTITQIMLGLGLIARHGGLPTKKGRVFLQHAFGHLMIAGG